MRIVLTRIILTALTGGLILAGRTCAGEVMMVRQEPGSTRVEQGKQDERGLVLRTPVARNLAGGEAHTYLVTLSLDQFLHVVVDHKGIDLVVTAFGPDGQRLAEGGNARGTQGQTTIFLVAETTGHYRLEVCSLQKDSMAGRYEINIKELRQPTLRDRNRITANKITVEADRLTAQGTAESLRKAIEKYLEALPFWRALEEQVKEVQILNEIGVTYWSLGEPQRALEYYAKALSLSHASGNEYDEGKALNNIGLSYWSLDENQHALECYERALFLFRAIGEPRDEARTLNNIGLVHFSLGENQRAIGYFNQALPLRRATGDHRGEAVTLHNIGMVYSELGERPKALKYYLQALSLRKKMGDRRGEAKTLSSIGAIYSALGEYKKAFEYYDRALPLKRSVGDRTGEAITLDNIGDAYASLGEYDKAMDYYNHALLLGRAVGNRSSEAMTLSHTAHVERKRGDLDTARTYIESALDIVESLRTKVATPEGRASYVASKQTLYEFHVDLLMQMHKQKRSDGFLAEALEASERARARSLLEILTEAKADIRRGVDPLLLERQRSLQQQLNARELDRVRLVSSLPTDEQAEAAKKELDALLSEYRDLRSQIRAKSPRYAALTQPVPLSLREIQREVLDEDTLLLEYALGEERSHLWAVTPTSITSFDLPNKATIERAARRLYNLLTVSHKREPKRQAELAAQELSRIVLGPVAAQLGKKRLLIVSGGALQYIPFGALPAPGVETPLIVDHEIVTLPSASVLAVLRRELAGRSSATKILAVLADPVFQREDPRFKKGSPTGKAETRAVSSTSVNASIRQTEVVRSGSEAGQIAFERLIFTRQEAEAIADLVPEGLRLKALDFAANRATATGSEIYQYRIVHFATHGVLNTQHPELSGIVLSTIDEQKRPQDGFLRLHDIYNLELAADLVVLSACQTALGKEVKGEGLFGLTRGFMYAGAPRVVATLWDVKDAATAELMKRFYKGMLHDGLRPAAALRAAQVSIWKEKRWEAPYYWAGFVLQGEWKK